MLALASEIPALFAGGAAQMSTIAANSAAPIISGISSLSPWAAQAAAPALATPSYLLPGATAAAEVSPWVGFGASSAAGGAGAGSSAAGAAGAGAGVGAGTAAAAVVGSGIAGLAAGTGLAHVVDNYGKGGIFGENEYGQERSAFDWASDQGHGVSDFLGGGTLGDVGGAATAGLLSIPAALYGGVAQTGANALGSLYDWIAD